MKNRYYILGFLAALMGVMVSLYSCTDELEGMGNASTRPTDVVCFTASLSDGRKASVSRGASGQLAIEQEEWLVGVEKKQGASRGAPVSLLSGSAGVIGYEYVKSNEKTNIQLLSSFNKKRFNFDGDELTAESDDVRWSTLAGKDSVLFYAYAPFDLGGTPFTAQETIGPHALTYTVKDVQVKDQKDLIVASWKGKKGTNYGTGIQSRTIPLTFEHALTAVKFKVGFKCTVTKLEIKGIYNSGTYTFGSGWSVLEGQTDYTFNFDENGSFSANAFLTDGDNTLMMIPQTLHGDAEVVLTTTDYEPIRIPLGGKVWQPGKMITYTIHKDKAPATIYFDLAAGNVMIGVNSTESYVTETKYGNTDYHHGTKYFGAIYVGGERKEFEGEHKDDNIYYVYQSSTSGSEYGPASTGYATLEDFNTNRNCRIPSYRPVTYNGKSWSDFITNNTSVDDVIEIWDDGKNIRVNGDDAAKEQHIGTAVVRKVGRTHTKNHILIKGGGKNVKKQYRLIVDDIYTTWQYHDKNSFRCRNYGGITYYPNGNTELIVNLLGDNRVGYVHINNETTDSITFEGTGTLTAANADFITPEDFTDGRKWDATYYGILQNSNERRYISNHRKSAIGNDTHSDGHVYNLTFNSGTIFAGTTKIENCSGIGGGGNGYGQVTVNGGKVTAVATTTGSAIGGGIGFSDVGGEGKVHISGGNVYAYNLENRWGIPSSSIGGGGSRDRTGKGGNVSISGGYVYAYSALGTAIGGGSSQKQNGGNATITITGGQVIAKSGNGAGIGGGSSRTIGTSSGSIFNGGTATIKILGNPIVRTGSIGGGKTGDPKGKLGYADITVEGGDIQAQFVMEAGSTGTPKFTMRGGTIRNSYVDDEEYIHIKTQGGAVYLEDGTFTMTGGTIKNCSAEQGGAVYIERKSTEPMDEDEFNFKMTGGKIVDCFATGNSSGTILGHGGAVCLNGGQVLMTGGNINNNYSENGDGGAIYINNGNFTMRDDNLDDNDIPPTTISGNSAQRGNGGGVFVSSAGSGVQVNLLHGLITNNAASNYGGGVCVDMGVGTSYSASVMVGEERQGDEQNTNPNISGNTSLMSGGGLYVRGASANITINGGNIKGNSVSAYVKNENVANEGGMVTLNADNVTDIVTITFHDIDGSGNETVYTQKVVSNTNTNLQKCNAVINGKNFVRWNNRSDGNGTIEYKNGDKINISENITLYAIREDQK